MLNHLLSLNIDKSWRRRTVQKLTPAQNLLDVAIGTADLSLEIMRQQKATKIQGIDVSREMMRIGKEKVSKVDLQKIFVLIVVVRLKCLMQTTLSTLSLVLMG